jgi:hypothetical protein
MNVENDLRIIKVFVSSPVDVAPERGRVQAVATKLNRDYDGLVRFETVLWEEHFYKADRSYQPQIDQIARPEACDILVSIFGRGSAPSFRPTSPACRTASPILRAPPTSC